MISKCMSRRFLTGRFTTSNVVAGNIAAGELHHGFASGHGLFPRSAERTMARWTQRTGGKLTHAPATGMQAHPACERQALHPAALPIVIGSAS